VLADAAHRHRWRASQRIEGVIGHEYFHNWTGNRITCRDWFQLSLEGGAHRRSATQQLQPPICIRAAVKRIEDVRMLRNTQFREDAGPTAHPIQPDHYVRRSTTSTPPRSTRRVGGDPGSPHPARGGDIHARHGAVCEPS
jgi:aminopeptidase N